MAVNDFTSLLLGEAGGKTAAERYNDMLHIASVVVNRSRATGRPVEDIIANQTEFNAWGKALPAGTEQFRNIAEQAIKQVAEFGPVTDATFYATPKAKDNLPSGLSAATKTASHEFFTDPLNRSIGTSQGYAKVSPVSVELAPPLPLTAPAPFGPLDMRMEPFAPQYANLVPPTVAGRTITPGAGLANLAPAAPPPVPGSGYGAISYAHPNRGEWSKGMSPEAVQSVQIMAAGTPDGAAITSAYRPPEINRSVGGARGSLHQSGNAYDVDLRGKNEQQRADAVELAMMSGANRLGSYSREPNMLHVDFGKGFDPTNGTVYAMHNRSNRNMASAPDWFTKGMEQVTVPTPAARPDMPAVPAPAPNFAGGLSPRGAQTIAPAAPVQAAMPAPAPQFNAEPARADPFAVLAPPPVPSMAGTGRATAGVGAQGIPAPFAMPDMLSLPQVAPVPMPAPRNEARDFLGGLMGPASRQIGRNVRSNMRGERINPFAGIPAAYRASARDLGNKFGKMGNLFGGGLPAPSPFNVGTGLAAIQSVTRGGAPGATAYSASHPGASVTVNAYGQPEFTSQHGFTGVAPEGFFT